MPKWRSDRCILIDEKGSLIDGDFILAIIAKSWKDKNILKNNTVVGTSMSNTALQVFKAAKYKFIRTDVGDRNIIKKNEKNLVLGGEPSGHIILSNLSSSGDGLLASLEVLNILKETGKKLSFVSTMFKSHPQLTKNFPIKKGVTAESILNNAEKEISILRESLKATGWLLVRKSGTEN